MALIRSRMPMKLIRKIFYTNVGVGFTMRVSTFSMLALM